MKKVLFLIILAVLFIPVVKAERVWDYGIGDYFKNGDVISLYTGVNNVYYYDGTEEVCSDTNVEYNTSDGYAINCDKGKLWELIGAEDYTFVFRKVAIKEGANIYRMPEDYGYYDKVLKKGDIILFGGYDGAAIFYPEEGYEYSWSSLGNDFEPLNNSSIVVGYEPTDWTKEIEGSVDSYLLVEYYYSSSSSGGFTFVPYKEPEFSIKCDKNILLKGEETDCHIEVDSNYNIENITFDLKSKVLGIKEYTEVNDKYRLEEEDNHFEFILKETEGIGNIDSWNFYNYFEEYLMNSNGKEELLKFKIVANENIDTTEVLSADDITYRIAFLDGSSEVSYEFVNNNKPVKNPETASNVVIAIVIAIVTITILVYLKNKRMTYDV